MTKLHRKDLKQDEIRETVADAVKSVSLHGKEIIYIIVAVIAVAFIAFAWFYYENSQNQQSQNLLGTALEKYNAPIGDLPPGSPKPAFSFKTESEKYSAALKDFEGVIAGYGNTQAAQMARYMAGVCSFYLKDFSKSEEYLKQAGKVSDRSILYFQSRMALADLYGKTAKPDQAVQILQDLSKNQKSLIPQEYVLLKLAESLSKAGKEKEAKDTYRKILDQYKDSPVSYQAQAGLDQTKD